MNLVIDASVVIKFYVPEILSDNASDKVRHSFLRGGGLEDKTATPPFLITDDALHQTPGGTDLSHGNS